MQLPPVDLLQPIAPINQQPPPQTMANNTRTTKLGATWADTTGAINIDVDNLLAPRSPKLAPAPSINQLKSSPNSPAHKPMPTAGMMSMGFMQGPLINNNFIPPTGGLNNNMTTNIRPPFANQNTFFQ
ncbi:unnamed protein product [Parnassius apollo]|uniref:(apollo) hypothetical protein n=1 Tax=Parnassius apollo TaxID=110799 RepID=A0A8S3XH88_PARAO|nr:unnamed protein product [Parnassius apollo]